MQDYVIIIPARFQSSRFPGKPLALILGESLIKRVWTQCIKAVPGSSVYVATDSDVIKEHCLLHGIQVIMTPSTCLTGTDRVYEASKQIDAKIYINVQGDEPLIDPQDILDVIDATKKYPNTIINAMCPITKEEEFRSTTVPKVVASRSGRLLYMSRQAIPTTKNLEFIRANKQVCIYAFTKQSLADFANLNKKTAHEELEDIEILRFLELDYKVQMIEVSSSAIAVDIPDDILRVEQAINSKRTTL